MSASVEEDTVLLTEHLTYRPIALIDDIINSINELSIKAINAVEKGLLSASPANIGFRVPSKAAPDAADAILAACRYEIENGMHQFETLFQAKIDLNFDKLEVYALRNTLSVPPELRCWIRLRHYEGLSLHLGRGEGGEGEGGEGEGEGDALTREKVDELRRRYREALKLHALLAAEKARNEATIRSLKMLLVSQGGAKPKQEADDTAMDAPAASREAYPAFAFLQDRGDLSGHDPLSTTTSFALSQVPALKSLLENLEPRLRELRDGDGESGAAVDGEQKTWRRTRLEFVEKETRRHLEDVRGLELGKQGGVRDGEWQGEGRGLAMGEVESLEKVVGIVGGVTEGDPMDQSA